jgi:GT2 family glycosyltransferase
MSETCLISVLMPVYDGEAYLGRALDSLRGQVTPPPFEVLAGDDGSTDCSSGLLRAAAETLPLRIFPGPGRGSWVANTNELLARAKGRYVTFLHQDDAYAPDRLARLAAAAAEHPDVPFFANDTRFIGPAGTVLGPWTPPLPDGFVSPADALEGMLVQNNFSVPAVLLRRDLIDELGPMDESLTYTADWDYWLRAMSRHGVYHLPHALSSFGIHAGSQTTTLAAKIEEMRRNLETVRDRFLPCARDLLPAAGLPFVFGARPHDASTPFFPHSGPCPDCCGASLLVGGSFHPGGQSACLDRGAAVRRVSHGMGLFRPA